jgi:hypothetical protein
MSLYPRVGVIADVAEAAHCCFNSPLDTDFGRMFHHEWLTFTSCPSTVTLMIEDHAMLPKPMLCLVAQVAFVCSEFYEQVINIATGHRAFLNARALEPIAGRKNALLTASELARENTSGRGVHALIVRWHTRDTLAPHEKIKVALSTNEHTNLYFCGYNLKSISADVMGDSVRVWAEGSGLRTRCQYLLNPPEDIFLMGLTRQEALEMRSYGTNIARLFLYRAPMLKLTSKEKRLLWLALHKNSDEVIGRLEGVKSDAINARWDTIADKMREHYPEVIGAKSTEQKRGSMFRHLILTHILQHPEELR